MSTEQEEIQEPSVSETEEGLVIEGDENQVVEHAEQLANQDIEAGFNRARGVEEEPEDTSDSDELQIQEELMALRTFRDEANERLEKATKKIQSLEGFKGSIKQQIEQGVRKALEEMKGSDDHRSPSSEEIETAMVDGEALAQLIEEYPSFAPMAKSIEAMSKRLNQLGEQGTSRQEPEKTEPAQPSDLSELDEAFPDWRQKVVKTDFKEFVLEGGPDLTDYEDVARKAQSGTQDLIDEANEEVGAWRQNYPDWWKEKGADLFGGASGSMKLLKEFDSRGDDSGSKDDTGDEGLDSETRKNLSRQKRIRRTATPQAKGGAAPTTGLDNAEAFERGFNKHFKK